MSSTASTPDEHRFVLILAAFDTASANLVAALRALDEHGTTDDLLAVQIAYLTRLAVAEHAETHLPKLDVGAALRASGDREVKAMMQAVGDASEQALSRVTHPLVREVLSGLVVAESAAALDDFLRSLRPQE